MKRLAAMLLTVVLLSALVAPALAKDDTGLTKAILLAKSFFPETDTYKSFNSNQESYAEKTIYHLHWSNSTNDPADSNPSRLYVRVDGTNKLILSYNFEMPNPQTESARYPALHQWGPEHCQIIAEEFVGKIVPEQFATMRLAKVDKPTISVGKRYWPHHYSYHYVRYENEIPFTQNGLIIHVNADTGDVTNYDLTWDSYDFPAPTGIIPLEEAEAVFAKSGLKLVYSKSYSYNEEQKPYLAYVLENGRNVLIDAFTGELTRDNYMPHSPLMPYYGTKQMTYDSGLTPYEIDEIEKVAALISAESAEKLAREVINLPEEIPLRGSYLSDDWNRKARFWSLEFEHHLEDSYKGASARVNAATGELESFYFWEKDKEQQPNPTLTHEEALTIDTAFLEKWAPNKYKTTELVKHSAPSETQPLPYSYGFTFSRLENGIPVSSDSLGVSVRHDKRVISYHMNWYDGEFVSPTGTLTKDEMSDLFLETVGLDLGYVLTHNQLSSKYEKPAVKLVYWPKEHMTYNFDAFSGKAIDHSGKIIEPTKKPIYTDITGHWAVADIEQLVELGLLRLPGDTYRPDDVVTLGDLLTIISDASRRDEMYYIHLPQWLKDYSKSPYAVALTTAANQGIITVNDKVDVEALVTREMLAFYLARMQGHGETTKLQGIWWAPFTDFRDVAPEYQGSVAVVHALGLMGTANSAFRPGAGATRAEVAVILARMLYIK